jgi:vacuolar-type H+-ATPase subunit F/Vma7
MTSGTAPGTTAPAGRVAALGEELRVQGFGLAGALVVAADTPEAAGAAWQDLPADVTLVILTPDAARFLAERLPGGPPDRLTVVMPG